MAKVDTHHPDYDLYVAVWQKNRHFAEGQRAVKNESTTYLPQREKEEVEEYNERLAATNFYNATARTISGYLGALFRKDPNYEVEKSLEEYINDFTNSGESATTFARTLAEEMLMVNRGGILLDRPLEDETTGSRGTYLAYYKAEQIINWKIEKLAGENVCTLLVLKEQVLDEEKEQEDKFSQSMVTQYRVLEIVDGFYQVEVYRQEKEGSSIMIHTEAVNPTMNGQKMDRIPFITFSQKGVSWDIERPVLDDLVEVNHGHFLNSSQYEHVLKFAGNPMLFLKDPGIGEDETVDVVIGSSRAYLSTDESADAKFIELEGKSIPAIRDAMEDKEKRMAVLGARLLEEQKRDAEAAETVRLRQSGEGGILGNIAQALSQVMAEVMKQLVRWDYRREIEPKIAFNRDFVATRLGSQELTALLAMRQAGEISQSTFLHNMMKGEILPDGVTVEDEKELIEVEAPELDVEGIEDQGDDDEETEE